MLQIFGDKGLKLRREVVLKIHLFLTAIFKETMVEAMRMKQFFVCLFVLHLGTGSEAVDSQELNCGDVFYNYGVEKAPVQQNRHKEEETQLRHSHGNKLWRMVKNEKMIKNIKIHREAPKKRSCSLTKKKKVSLVSLQRIKAELQIPGKQWMLRRCKQ